MAVLTTALTRLRSDFNTRFPSRDTASDGWIGDTRHQAETSGHNPDDTPGSKAEYSDADSKAEVRAVDVDKDLHDPVTMQQVVDAILRTPADLRRLKYIIYQRRIWSATHGWVPRTYTGSNPHDQHAHFSGDPAYDEDGRAWSSVLNIGRSTQEDDMTPEEHAWLKDVQMRTVFVDGRVNALASGKETVGDGYPRPADPQWATTQLRAIVAKLDQLAATPPGSVAVTDEQLTRVLRPIVADVLRAGATGAAA